MKHICTGFTVGPGIFLTPRPGALPLDSVGVLPRPQLYRLALLHSSCASLPPSSHHWRCILDCFSTYSNLSTIFGYYFLTCDCGANLSRLNCLFPHASPIFHRHDALVPTRFSSRLLSLHRLFVYRRIITLMVIS